MKKLQFLFSMLLLSFGVAHGNLVDIPMIPDDPTDPEKDVSRSINAIPTASLDDPTLTVSFPMSTTLQVAIFDAETDAVVFSAPYDATRQVEISLLSLPEGSYTLRVYAFGKWWVGEFMLGGDE